MSLVPRHRIDLSFGDLRFAWRCLVAAPDRNQTLAALRSHWSEPVLVALSVRTAWDALLRALALPPGSEVLISAMTVPHMEAILRLHDLVPVPIDLEVDTLAPRLDALRTAGTAPRLLLVAHLLGGRIDMEPVIEIARARGLLVVEDLAQGFRGPGDTGSPASDVHLFSFGAIKTATALGGAVCIVRDPALRNRMATVLTGYRTRPVPIYAKKLAMHSLLLLIRQPRIYGFVAGCIQRLGLELDAVINGAVRGLPPGDSTAWVHAMRQQPSSQLLALLARRLARFDRDRLSQRSTRGETVVQLQQCTGAPGRHALHRTWWLIPVRTADPLALQRALRAKGFDASQGTTSLVALGEAPNARALLEGTLFVPAYPELSHAHFDQLCKALHQEVSSARRAG